MDRKIALIILGISALLAACTPPARPKIIQGITMGTYYQIIFYGDEPTDIKPQIDSLLKDFNHTFSVFDTASMISSVNKSVSAVVNEDFCHVFNVSKQIYEVTGGAFDPTIEPLINLWGFGRDSARSVSDFEVDSLMRYLGFGKITLSNDTLYKENQYIVLNFNAIAKGFGVDKVAHFLKMKGYSDFVVEIGGEIVTNGTKAGKPWRVGIQVPTEERDGAIESEHSFVLDNAAVATSGNYRNYREENGVRYSHIINPKTGYPEKSDLLSVTVIASDCITADALATAFMVLGKDKSMQILEQHPEWSAYFICSKDGKFVNSKTANFPD